MIDRLKKILERNLPFENREATWNFCMSYNSRNEITEESMENMADNDMCFGMFGGSYIGNDEESHRLRAIYSQSKLAEMLGASDDMEDINNKIGFEIFLPEFIGGRTVLKTDRGILSDRHCHYLWVMKRIIDLCPDRNSSILEIGGGLGLLGYFLSKAGYKDYTNIDLAYQNLTQAYFLYRNLPERDMILSGERDDPFDLKYKDSLKLLHSSEYKSIKGRFDIMINIDSLPEMNLVESAKYVSSEVSLLLSINRENYNFEAMTEALRCRDKIYRVLFPLRNDSLYYEELYKLKL